METSRLNTVCMKNAGVMPEVGLRLAEQSAAVRGSAGLTGNVCCAVTLWRKQLRFPLAVLPNLAHPHSSLEAQVAAVLPVEALHLPNSMPHVNERCPLCQLQTRPYAVPEQR